MPRAILNKSWRQHPTKQQQCDQQPPITKTMKIRRTRHAGHYWRSWDELMNYVLLWTPSHGRAKAGQPARTYIQQLYADTGCSLEYLPEAMNNREVGWERARDIRADDKMMMMMMIMFAKYRRLSKDGKMGSPWKLNLPRPEMLLTFSGKKIVSLKTITSKDLISFLNSFIFN